ncbi:uncharacterized protein HGUI_02537 [Hanseniaspora guilliermondii]|uniref:Uncharacterized protein n=1 Tax=Hanseniaspora guilliermondii TaxID=56406 RepID=A0A1L0CPE1_9ASCO|nr:uncharacterized protein HGUI_02537 [Hanseniaspora guilliermondii]
MNDTDNNFTMHSQSKHDIDMNECISRSNSNVRNGSNPHSIFERTVEDNLNNTPLLMQHAQRRLSRTSSVVSFNNKSNPISIDNSRSNSNIYQSLSNSSNVHRRPSVMSSHRHSENFIAPSLDSTCQIINDNNTTIDDLQVEDHPLSNSLPSSPNSSIFSPPGTNGQKINSSPSSSPNDYFKGNLSRRPSTIGLDMALGVKDDQSPPLKLNTFSFNNTSLSDSPLAQGNSPRLVRFQSYADVLSEEASSLRRPSFGNMTNGSQTSIKPQSSQDILEFQFNKQPSLLKRNSSITISNNDNTSSGITSKHSHQAMGSSPLSSPIFTNKQHPLKNVVSNNENIQKGIFDRVSPNDYKKYDSKEKSPFHQLSNKS